jgi:hypothetical protein
MKGALTLFAQDCYFPRYRGDWGGVCDKFVGKAVKRTPDFPRNPPIGCSEDCTGGR